jgi:hypothetical protein
MRIVRILITITTVLLLLSGLTGCTTAPPVEVVSVNFVGTLTPPSPDGSFIVGGPQPVEITVKNTGRAPVYYFSVVITVPIIASEDKQETYAKFNISPANPLKPGDSRTGTFSIPEWSPVYSYYSYPLKITAITPDDHVNEYTVQVKVTASVTSFKLPDFGVTAMIPVGWAAAVGPESIVPGRVDGLVSINSWGKQGFWPHSINNYNADGSIRSTGLNAGDLYSMIPSGGAFIILEKMDTPPFIGKGPTEYSLNDLSGLYEPHDWRQDSSNFGYSKSFFKAGSQLGLGVVCNYYATDETVAQINDLLKSWKFGDNTPQSSAVFTTTIPVIICSPTASVTSFKLPDFGVTVEMLDGWASVLGPTTVATLYMDGLLAFNSWGQKDFWAKEKDQRNSDGLGPLVYGDSIIASQIPAGGAYITLLSRAGVLPTVPPDEYIFNDLSGLYQPHDWRQDYVFNQNFYKEGNYLTLTVACSHNATDETVAQINDLLQSWHFINLP